MASSDLVRQLRTDQLGPVRAPRSGALTRAAAVGATMSSSPTRRGLRMRSSTGTGIWSSPHVQKPRWARRMARSYTSARLQTFNEFQFKYGLVEARIKVPSGAGSDLSVLGAWQRSVRELVSLAGVWRDRHDGGAGIPTACGRRHSPRTVVLGSARRERKCTHSQPRLLQASMSMGWNGIPNGSDSSSTAPFTRR